MSILTVKKLITQLRKMPPDALVVWKDHDNSPDEFNNYVRFVSDVTDDLSTDPDVRYVAIEG